MTTTPALHAFSILCAATLAAITSSACSDDHTIDPAEVAEISATARVTARCVDLAGSPRSRLRVTEDGRGLTFLETRTTPTTDGEATDTFDLVAYDLARETTTTIQADVSQDIHTMSEGALVFTRNSGPVDLLTGSRATQLLVVRPGSEPRVLATKDQTVGRFVVDDATATIYYEGGSFIALDVFRQPVGGGEPTKIVEGGKLLGFSRDRQALLVNGYGIAKWIAVQDGAEQRLELPHRSFLASTDTHLYLSIGGDRLAALPVQPGASFDRGPVDLGFDLHGSSVEAGDGRLTIFTRREADTTAYTSDGGPPVARLTVTGAGLAGMVELADGRLAALVTNDTNGDGILDTGEDESDLCFFPAADPGAPAAVPTRVVPKQYLARTRAILAALPPEFAGDVRWLRDGAAWTLVIERTGAGPTDLVQLRDEVRTLRKALQPHLEQTMDIRLHYRTNGRRAVSTWNTATQRHFASAGIGPVQLADPTEYAVEVDPKVTTTIRRESYGPESAIGRAVCSGTVRNRSDRPLGPIGVECKSDLLFEVKSARGKLKPAELAPGQTGSYKITIAVADGDHMEPVDLSVGAVDHPYINVYFERQLAGFHEALVEVQASTGLMYLLDRVTKEGFSYSEKRIWTVRMRVPEDFAARTKAQQVEAVAAAKLKLEEHFSGRGDRADQTILDLYEFQRDRLGWRYQDGELTAVRVAVNAT